jgi:putative glutamine amidotransferase
MIARPVLGITCCNRPLGAETAQAVIDRYVRAAMTWADASALLAPAIPELMHARDVAARLDGLLLTGSPSNVEASRYGEAAADADGPFDPGRDAMALALIEAMLALGRPVFGVCRGLQEINVAFGGALSRDVAASGLAHHAPPETGLAAMFAHQHDVDLAPGGVLATASGRRRLRVNSVHYQGISRLGEGLRVEALAPDGLVEAVSAVVGGGQVLAVQWHPEWRTQADEASRLVFQLLGRAMRGEMLDIAAVEADPPAGPVEDWRNRGGGWRP